MVDELMGGLRFLPELNTPIFSRKDDVARRTAHQGDSHHDHEVSFTVLPD